MRRTVQPLLPVVAALSLLLAACSSGPGGSTGPITHPSGDDLVFRMEYSGGFVAPAFLLTSFPQFTLTGDGRVIVPGAQVDLFPGPALPAANVRRLTEAGIQAILNEIARTGFFGASIEFRGARNVVADASDTVFTLHADAQNVKVVVYALGTLEPGANVAGMSAAEFAAHRILLKLSERLTNLEAWLPASAWAEASWRPYQPDALRLLVRNADADPPDDTGIGNKLVDWPDASDPATFGVLNALAGQRCGVVSGQSAQDWYTALSSANQLTRFLKDDHRYEVVVRFMLPDERRECPKAAA
ncbi:MAG: hypothetical protein ABI978_02775 [Chloroflexota bacterium]